MMKIDDYTSVLELLIPVLKKDSEILALWEGGSASTGNKDSFSDLDLCIYTSAQPQLIFEKIEALLQKQTSGINHRWNITNSPWPGLSQRMYVLKKSPKFFFIDAGIFHTSSEELMMSFLEQERHGQPLVHFDKTNKIKKISTDPHKLNEKKRKRLDEISESFPIYEMLVMKEITRNHPIDAFSFYQNGLLRPLVETLGMIHRPFQFDFGFRYIHRSLPEKLQNQITSYCYVQDLDDLKKKAEEINILFKNTIDEARRLLR